MSSSTTSITIPPTSSTTKTINPLYFINKYINNSPKVPSTKIDKVLKAIINTYRSIKDSNSRILIDYLNRVRVVYFIKRLKYYSPKDYRECISKLLPYSTILPLYLLTPSSRSTLYE